MTLKADRVHVFAHLTSQGLRVDWSVFILGRRAMDKTAWKYLSILSESQPSESQGGL